MAISVKTFINPLNCDEPAYEVPILYHPTSAGEICNGNGTTTNIYGDFANLADIATNSGTGNAGNSDICQEGMDVVFVVDYTGSMSNAISGVKQGINDIVTEIQSQSNGNYRLGLVLFDGTNAQLQNGYVGQSDFYADLDPTQKINTGNNVITCVEKMNLVGNQSTFATHLGYLDQPDGPAGMSLGAGTECGGVASYEVIQNSFAGQWRANVLKLVILITDDEPEEGFANGNTNGTDPTYFNNTLIPAADTNNVQVFSNIAEFTAGNQAVTANTLLYSSLSNGTTPAGQAYTGLDFTNNTWIDDMIDGITTLCVETTTYTCDPAPAGWYTDAPLAAGATIYYWDGSAWVASHDCQYTVTVDLIDNISNGSVDDIALNHPNQLDLDTFTFTGAPGSTHTATIGCTVDSGYTNLSVNVSNVSDTNVVTNTSVNNLTDEVTITVEIPTQDELNHSIQINGSATQVQRTVRFDVINNTNDNTNAVGGGQTPIGQVEIEVEAPGAWIDVSNIYSEDAKRYTFSGVSGDTHAVDVNFLPNPSDYTINVTSVTVSYFELDGSTSSTATTLGQTAIANLSLNGSYQVIPFDYTGNLEIPNGDVWVKVFVNADINQPIYRYTLHASDSITGATVSPAQQLFQGYTGSIHPFTVTANADSGYNNVSVNTANLNLTYNENAAITAGPTVNNGNTGAYGTVTMPAGGGQGGIILGGTADTISYDYVITIDDSTFSTASWLSPVTLTGAAGTSPSVVVNSFSNNNYTYNLTGIQSNQGILTASISNANSMAILLDLEGGMPVGGGSATVTLTGTENSLTYSYSLSIDTDTLVLGQWVTNPINLTGTFGQVLTGSFNFNEVPNNTYSATGVTSDDSANSSGTLGTGAADLFDVNYSVTMPSGGGSGELTITGANVTPTQYSYTVIYDGSNLSGGNNHTATPASQVLTGQTNSVQAFQIDLDPSPSYYVINIGGLNNIISHDGGGTDGTAPELVITGYNSTTNVIDAELTMPANGGTGYIQPKGSSTSPAVNFTVTASEFISNATLTSPSVITFTGIAGSGPYIGTYTVTPSSGWNVNIASALVGNSYNNSLTSSINNTASGAETVDITLSTMPVGGGSSGLSITGNSSQQSYTANMLWDESFNIENQGDWDNNNNNFTGNAGDQFSIDNTWRIQNNTTFYWASNTNVTVSGTNYPTANPFSLLSSQSPTSGTSARTTGTFTMPVGGGTWEFTMDGRTQTTSTLPTFTCKADFYSLFSTNPGSVGDTIQFTWDGGPAPSGLNLTTTPSTYQLGNQTYRADFTVPSGYSNAGDPFACQFNTTGTTTTTTKPDWTCADSEIYINPGAVGDIVTVFSRSKSNGLIFTIGGTNPAVYQNGTTNYLVDIDVNPNATQYGNAGTTIVCSVSGEGTTTTTSTADPCIACNDTLFLDVDEYTKGNGPGVANGVLVAWRGGSDVCQYGSSNVQLYYSSTLIGSYTNLGNPTLYNYNETRNAPTTQTQIGGTTGNNPPSYILGVTAGLDAGYYYITAQTSAGCTITSPTVHMAVENTSAESSNKYMYLWGVGCDGDASESTNWFSASQFVREQVLMVNPGTTLANGNPNVANAYTFTNNSGATNMLAGDGFNYFVPHTGVTKQYWGCTDVNVLRIKVDLNTAAGRAAFDSIGSGQAYEYSGDSLTFNSDLDGNIKFCGIAMPPRQHSIFGSSNGTWNYNNGKAFRFPGTIHMSNSQSGVGVAVSAPHLGTASQIKEDNATANPALTSSDWATCYGLAADCTPVLDDPKGGDRTISPSPGPGGGGGGEEISEIE